MTEQKKIPESLAEFRAEAMKKKAPDYAMAKAGAGGQKFTYVQWMYAHLAACDIDGGLVPYFSPVVNAGALGKAPAPGVYYLKGEETHVGGTKKNPVTRTGPTCMVVAGFTLSCGTTVLETLAVTDSANRPIPNPPADEVNNTLKRCYVKALALAGLYSTVFTGEDTLPGTASKDLPQNESPAKAAQDKDPATLKNLMLIKDIDSIDKLKSFYQGLPEAQRIGVAKAIGERKAELAR
jgi:hypothetical protein